MLLVAVLLGACSDGYAQQDNKAGTTAAQFLKIGVGARAAGMAGAMVGLASDPEAMYWNVSGLTSVRTLTLHATYTSWFAGMSHQYFGIVLPASEDHVFGLNATVFNVGEIEITTEREPTGTGDFYKASDVAIGVSYATRLVDFFSFGVTAKYISQSLYNETASAVAIDLASTLRTGYKGLTIGMAFTNFGTSMKLEGRDLHRTYDPSPDNATNTGVSSYLGTESWDLPVNFRVGIGWQLLAKEDALWTSESNRVQIGVDANHPNDGPENAVVGLEYEWQDLLALRGGYHFNDDVRTWSVGGGVRWSSPGSLSVGVDYAYSDFDRLGAIHIFSVAVGF